MRAAPSTAAGSAHSAHARAAASLRAEGDLLRAAGAHAASRDSGGAAGAPSSPGKTAAAAAAPPPRGLVTFFFVVWALAIFAAAAFIIQGGTLESLSRRGGQRLVAAAAAAGVVRAGAGAADEPALALVRELTTALDAATSALAAADAEAAGLRAKLRGAAATSAVVVQEAAAAAPVAGGASGGGGGGGGGSGGSTGSRAAAAAVVAAGAAAAAGRAATKAAAAAIAAAAAPPAPRSGTATAAGVPTLDLYAILSSPPPLTPCVTCVRLGAALGTRTCVPAPCPATPAGAARIVSTSLYGDEPRYVSGVVRNAELMSAVMPGWVLRVYTKADALPPADVLAELRRLGADVITLAADDPRAGFGMNWRFLVADDAGVEAFVIRDADGRVSLRDADAIDDWLRAPAAPPFHVVRDHPSHANYPLMGGTWGARAAVFRGPLPTLASILSGFYANKPPAQYGSDIDFLSVRGRTRRARLSAIPLSRRAQAPSHPPNLRSRPSGRR
jgi:hypothetical protein